MARALFLNAILSGKLGGTVYAHNKAGPYVRQFSMPTNPNTLAQGDARADFASSVTLWQAMNPVQKAAWNSYATAYFKAKHDDPTVLYSGFNAFCSLCNASRNANRMIRTASPKGSTTEDLVISQGVHLCAQTPPQNTFSADIKDAAGLPLNVGLAAAHLDDDGNGHFKLGFHAQATAVDFTDPVSGMKVGYNLYASNIVQQEEQFVTKPNLTIIASTGPLTYTSGWTESHDCILFQFLDCSYATERHKLWYTPGDVIRLEVWAIGSRGPLIKIGQTVVTVAVGTC